MQEDTKTIALKMGIGAGGAVISGLTLNEWIQIATLTFLVMQIGLLIPKYWALFIDWWRGRR